MIRNFFTYCYFVITCFCFGQNEQVILEINPTGVEVGEIFSLTVTSTVPGTIDIENLPASFIQDFDVRQGSSQKMDYSTGDYTEIYFITYTGQITSAGEYNIGPAWVKTGNKSYKSNRVEIKVSKKQNMSYGTVTAGQLNDPAFGVIECNKKEIYEGEPLLLTAKFYSYFDPTDIGGYQSYQLNSTAVKHPVGNPKDIKVVPETFKGKKLRAFSYDKNIVFPDAVGSFQIDPFKANIYQGYRSFPVISSGLKVTVKALPPNPPSDFIGAVGSFELISFVDTNRIDQGDVIKLTLIIRGTGNLHNLIDPQLVLPKGFVVYGDPVPTENFTITSKGADGEVSYEYNIQITEYGNLKLPGSSVSYFDPVQEKYVRLETHEIDLDIQKNKSFRVPESESDGSKDREMIVHNTSIRTEINKVHRRDFFGNTAFWTGVSLPLMSALLFLLFIKRRENNEDKIRYRESVKERNVELNDQMSRLHTTSLSGSDNDFFGLLEQVLRTAVAIDLNQENNASLSKNDVLSCLRERGLLEEEEAARKLFSLSERYRYGFGGDTDVDKTSLYQDVVQIVKCIKR